MVNNTKTVVLGGGCFWCTEAVFKILNGVISVESGYSGGYKENPTYEEVSSHITGHAEVVKIDYNPAEILFEDILSVFFAVHDPTAVNRQGNDVGEQYRSVIFYSDEDQKNIAEKFIKELNGSNLEGEPIITKLEPLKSFYPAENYHKNYYENNKNQSYCQIIINPKLKKVQEKFASLLKKHEGAA